jgi:hypothetical protein
MQMREKVEVLKLSHSRSQLGARTKIQPEHQLCEQEAQHIKHFQGYEIIIIIIHLICLALYITVI